MTEPTPFDEFRALLDGRLDADASARLQARLDADPALRAEFDDYRLVHELTAPLVGAAPSSTVTFERLDAARRKGRLRRLRPWLAVAATLLVAVSAAAYYVHSRPHVVTLRAIRMDADVAAAPHEFRALPAALATYRPVVNGNLNWMTSLDDARVMSRVTGRPMFVWVYHPQCPMCVALDRGAMKDAGVQTEAANFVPVKLDVMKAPREAQRWASACWPYLASRTAEGKVLAEFACEMDAAKIREGLARGEGAAKDALPWQTLNETASEYAKAEEARAAGRDGEALLGYETIRTRLASAGDAASTTLRADADARLIALRRDARDALIEAKKLAATDEAAGARRLSEAAERFRGTPYGLDLAEVEQELRATGRFPVLVEKR